MLLLAIKITHKENRMSALFDFLHFIFDVGDIYERYGVKGCVLSVLVVVALLAIIIVLALWLG
jgi:uncharacterized membrane protein YwaF